MTTLLLTSAESRNDDLYYFQMALQNGADVNADGGSPLVSSCSYGHVNKVRFLLEHGARVNVKPYLISPLCAACQSGFRIKRELLDAENYLEIIHLLLDYGADIHEDNDAPLRDACESEFYSAAKLLIYRGANPSKINGDKADALKNYLWRIPRRILVSLS